MASDFAIPVTPRSALLAGHLARVAAYAAVAGALALIALHVVPDGRRLNPITMPLSKYALDGSARLFDIGIALLVVGLAGLLCALLLLRYTSPLSASSLAMAICCVGLLGTAVFPDETLRGRLTTAGWLHWTSSVFAFGALPIGTLLLRARPGHGRLLAARLLAALAACLVAGFFVGTLVEQFGHVPVWRIGGLAERMLAATEIAIAPVLARWAWRGASRYSVHYSGCSASARSRSLPATPEAALPNAPGIT